MRVLALATTVMLAGVVTAAAVEPLHPGALEPVAVVCLLEGPVSVDCPSCGETHAVELLDTLSPGAVLRTGADATAVVGLGDGRRWRLAAHSVVEVGGEVPELRSGEMRPLEPVPVVARLAPLAGQHGTDVAAARIRRPGAGASSDLGLLPRSGSTVLAGDLVLRFDPPPGYERFRVTVTRDWDDGIIDIEIEGRSLVVSEDRLRPGAAYIWTVTSLEPERPRIGDSAIFFTLDAEEAVARAALERRVEAAQDPSLVVLLAAVDRSLGLDHEACRDLARAAAMVAEPAAVDRARQELGCPSATP
jgi:hypothetical protein